MEQRRWLAVSLVQQGMRQADVARGVGTSRASVVRWCQAFQRGGENGLAAKPHPGPRGGHSPVLQILQVSSLLFA